jgi:serine/threonine protein kinase
MGLEVGKRLGRYEVQSSIGAGGMGEVYLALDTQLEREVALKVLSAEVAADSQRTLLSHPMGVTSFSVPTARTVSVISGE